MQNQRLQGWGVLTCGDVQTAVRYELRVLSDQYGNKEAEGRLYNVDSAVAFVASQVPLCRLVLENNQEIDVLATLEGDGSLRVRSSGPIADID